jgi:hypothetical protein
LPQRRGREVHRLGDLGPLAGRHQLERALPVEPRLDREEDARDQQQHGIAHHIEEKARPGGDLEQQVAGVGLQLLQDLAGNVAEAEALLEAIDGARQPLPEIDELRVDLRAEQNARAGEYADHHQHDEGQRQAARHARPAADAVGRA